VRQVLLTRNVGAMFGAGFTAFGCLMGSIFLAVAVVFPPMLLGVLICAALPLVGGGIGASAIGRAWSRIQTLRSGRVAVGSVCAVFKDLSVEINDRNPWRIEYLFEVDGTRHSGSVSSFNAETTKYEVGHPIHVVYRPRDPDTNAPWPPLG
jgi:hypothetical protein